MADITDDFGRTKDIEGANFEKLASMLKSAVKTTTDFISKSKEELGSKTLNKMEKALQDLGENIKKNVESAKKFVEDVKKVSEKLEKVQKTKKEKTNFEDLKKIQTEQSKILSMILKNQQKAKSEKLAIYTSGSSSLPKTKSLSDIGFKARGPDKYPAMLSKNEFVINEKAAKKHGPLLNRINQGQSFKGYRLGGQVKYLETGGNPWTSNVSKKIKTQNITPPSSGWQNPPQTIDIEANVKTKIEKIDESKINSSYEKLGRSMGDAVQKGFEKGFEKDLASFLVGTSTLLIGGNADFLQSLFQGSVKDATEFRKEMRMIAFQTEGVTGNFRNLQKAFSGVGDQIDFAGETGKDLSAYQENYLRNVKKGFKNNKQAVEVIKSGLNLSTMIGSETQQTADLFVDWHKRLHLSSEEMKKMSRDMRSVAKSTGVTGDELLGVMKSSEGILKNLKNQGNLTSDAGKNIITMMAEATKNGLEESTGRVLEALSSTNKMLDADDKTKSLIYTATNMMGGNATRQAQSGTFLKDRKNLEGLSDSLLKFAGQLSDGAIKTIDDFEKLNENEKKLLTQRLRGYGYEIKELKGVIETTKKASKGLYGQLEDVDKIINAKYSTVDQKKLAQQQKSEMLFGSSLDVLSAIKDKATGDKELSSVISEVMNNSDSDFKNRIEDLAVAGEALGIASKKEIMGMSAENKVQTAALISARELVKRGKEEGMDIENFEPALRAAIKEGDNLKFAEIMEKMQIADNKIGIEKATGVDPVSELVTEITKLNQSIRRYTSSFVGKAIDFIGAIGLLGVQIAMMAGALQLTIGSKFLETSSIIGIFDAFKKNKKRKPLDLDDWIDGLQKKQAGSLAKGKKSSNLFEVFGKGFKRSQDAGDGFFKSLTRGFKGSYKSLTPIGNRWKKNIISSLDVFGKNTEIVFKKMSSSFSKFANNTLPRIFDVGKIYFKDISRNVGKFGKQLNHLFVKGHIIDHVEHLGEYMMNHLSKGLSSARDGLLRFDKYIKNLGTSIKNNGGVIKSARKTLTGVYDGLLLIGDYGRGKFVKSIKAIPGMIKAIPGMIKAVFSAKGIAKGIGGIGKGLRLGISGIAKGARAALIGGSAGMLQIVFSVVDGIFGAFHGFSNTGKNFEDTLKAMGKSADEASWGMYASSTVAGTLTGVLDGLTFGLLGFLGITKFLEKALSLLSYTFFSVIEGIIEGFKWALGGIGPIFKSIGATLSEVGKSFLNIFNSIAGIFGAEASNLGEAFAYFYPFLKLIGKAIGVIVGSPIIALLYALSGALWVVAKAIQGIVFVVEKIVAGIVAPFKWLYNILVGNSIIPDLCTAIVGFFGKMAFNVMSIVGKMIWGVAKFFLKLPFKLLKGMFNFFVKFPLKMISDTLKMAGKIFTTGLPGAIRGLSKFFASFKGYFFEFSKVAFNTWYKLLSYLGGSWLSKAKDVFFNLLNWLAKGGAKAWDTIKNAGKWIKDTAVKVGGKVAGAGGKVMEGAKWAGGKAMQGARWVGDKISGFLPKKAPITGGGGAWSVPPEALKKTASNVGNVAKSAPSKLLGFFSKGGKLIGSLAKKLPAIGPLLDFGLRKAEGQSTGKAAFGAGGGLAGAAAGAAIGTAILPGIGTAIGGIIGAIGGGQIADVIYDNVGSAFGYLGEKIYDGASWLGQKMSDGAKWMGEKLYDGASWISDGTKWMGEKLYDGAGWVSQQVAGLGSNIWEGTKNVGSTLWEGTKAIAKTATLPQRMILKGASWLGEKTKDTAGWIGGKVADSAKWLGSWFGIGKSEKLAEDTSNKLKNTTEIASTPVGQHAVPTLKPDENVSAVQPIHLNSISDSILKDKAGSQGNTSKIQSDELSRIEEVSNKQVDELQLIREGIQSMVELLKPKENIAGSQSQKEGSTRDPRRPMHAAIFGKMKYGKAGGNANRTLINNGEV